MSEKDKDNDTGSTLMKMVDAIAISHEDAKALVLGYQQQVQKSKPSLQASKQLELVTKKIIDRYSKLSAASGGATALPGVIPGVGTAVALTGGILADVAASMKFQIDMTMCLAVAINGELTKEDAKALSFMIALTGTVEQATTKGATTVASKAAIRLLREHLKGPVLVTIKELFKKVGIIFTRKAAEKAIPLGIGVVVGASVNYALTRYVGKYAVDTLTLYIDEKDDISVA